MCCFLFVKYDKFREAKFAIYHNFRGTGKVDIRPNFHVFVLTIRQTLFSNVVFTIRKSPYSLVFI